MVTGPYTVHNKLYEDFHMDPTNFKIDVWTPTGFHNGTQFEEGTQFPLIAFNHGLGGGGVFVDAYSNLLEGLSSFGYIVAATRACLVGCWDSGSLKGDPSGYKDYYKQQLLTIDFGKDKLKAQVDISKGFGIAGHSMGAQATLFSSSGDNTSKYDIKAAVMHHTYTHTFPVPTIPFLAFTGGKDATASTKMTQSFYNGTGAYPVRGYVNRADADHMEPCNGKTYNPLLPQFTAAWFKLHLDKTPTMLATVDGKDQMVDFEQMIFGTGKQSICGVFLSNGTPAVSCSI